jgi:hypothetical protein
MNGRDRTLTIDSELNESEITIIVADNTGPNAIRFLNLSLRQRRTEWGSDCQFASQ